MKKDFIVATCAPFSPITRGVTEFGRTENNFELMKKAGITCVRMHGGFPFTDATLTELTESYKDAVEMIKLYHAHGIDTLFSFTNPGHNGVDGEGKVSYRRNYPDWMGPLTEDYYFEVLEKVAEFMAKDLAEYVTYWQVGNEPDFTTFIGELTHEQNEKWHMVAARGLKKGNPNAMCGINIAGISSQVGDNIEVGVHTYAQELITKLYRCEDSPFDYIGIDGYFGSWQPGGPETWISYIDDAHRVSGKPVFINEWGYSTLQRGKPRPEEDKKRFFNNETCREKDMSAGGYRWLNMDHSEEMQAVFIMEAFKIFAEHPAVKGEFFFQWQDMERCWQCGDDDCPAETSWGCIRKDGTPKPGYYALVKANKLYVEK